MRGVTLHDERVVVLVQGLRVDLDDLDRGHVVVVDRHLDVTDERVVEGRIGADDRVARDDDAVAFARLSFTAVDVDRLRRVPVVPSKTSTIARFATFVETPSTMTCGRSLGACRRVVETRIVSPAGTVLLRAASSAAAVVT